MITFGIITSGANDPLLIRSIQSIRESKVINKEIIVVGPTSVSLPDVIHIHFEEEFRENWITRKKNLIALNARFDTLVILHDYFVLNSGWNEQLERELLRDDWDAGSCQILNEDGLRFRDWCLWTKNHRLLNKLIKNELQLPYETQDMQKLQYLSGSVIFVKRSFLLSNPLDENLGWGDGEDVEWSVRVRNFWRLKFFAGASLKSQKSKEQFFGYITVFKLRFCRIYLRLYSIAPKFFKALLRSDRPKLSFTSLCKFFDFEFLRKRPI